MPPPNSTAQTPTLSPRVASPYLDPLELISSPVPDLAATLTTRADALANNDTISFLRTRLEGDTRLSPDEEASLRPDLGDNNPWREWDNRLAVLQRFDLGMSRRIPILREDEGTGYANRVPQRQSLYDWAPGSDDEDLYHELLSRANIPTFAQSARPQSRYLNLDSHRRSHSRSRIRPRDDDAGRAPSWAEAARMGHSPPRADSSTSTAALLQSVEQHRRFNARARSTLQSYILDRDRRDNDPTSSVSTWARLHRPEQQAPGSPYPAVRNLSSQADLRNAYRQLFAENTSLTRLKNSIRYLSKLRHCDTLEEGLTLATDLAIDDACIAGQARPFNRFSGLSDLIVETSSLPSVAECSWLTPGTVFGGSQHTSHSHPPVLLNRHSDRDPRSRQEHYHQDPVLALHDRQHRRSYARVATYRDRLPVPDTSITMQHGSPNPNPNIDININTIPSQQPLASPSDHWPVTITLHDVDPNTQTLSGTMSATHIPDKLCPQPSFTPGHSPHANGSGSGSSMRSFFEGEIIDFKTHSLLTENFCTGERHGLGEREGSGGVDVDARYWRGVGPFRELLVKEKAKRREENCVKRGKLGRLGRAPREVEMEIEDEYGDEDDDAVEDTLGGEDIIASHLRSRSWVENVLLKDWVLMRWKERCFIKDAKQARAVGEADVDGQRVQTRARGATAPTDPASWGLTISGFYYVALRRQTGEIDGLYYDPGSLPFQVLELRPEGGCLAGTGVEGERGPAKIGGLSIKRRCPAMGFR